MIVFDTCASLNITDQIVGDVTWRVFVAVEAEVDGVVLGSLQLALNDLLVGGEADDEETRSVCRLLPLHLRLVLFPTPLTRGATLHFTINNNNMHTFQIHAQFSAIKKQRFSGI